MDNKKTEAPVSDIFCALRQIDGEIESYEEITRLRAPGKKRGCYRVHLIDGRIVKGRCFDSHEQRESFSALCSALVDLPFSRVLSAHGSAIIEEWIAGSSVSSHELSCGMTGKLAAVLGHLNGRRIPSNAIIGAIAGVDWHAARLRNLLAELNDKQRIDSAFAGKLIELADDHRPKDFACGLIHTDFHPQNMIRRQQDDVWIIDNEGLRIGVLDFDIARCWRRWPMTNEQRTQFQHAYSDFRSLTPFLENQTFWAINTLVLTATINERYGRPIEGFLTSLSRIVDNDAGALWPSASV